MMIGSGMILRVMRRVVSYDRLQGEDFTLLLVNDKIRTFGSLVHYDSEVSAKIEYIKVRLERFEDLLTNTNTAENRDFQELRKGA